MIKYVLTVIVSAALYTACEMIVRDYRRKKATRQSGDLDKDFK